MREPKAHLSGGGQLPKAAQLCCPQAGAAAAVAVPAAPTAASVIAHPPAIGWLSSKPSGVLHSEGRCLPPRLRPISELMDFNASTSAWPHLQPQWRSGTRPHASQCPCRNHHGYASCKATFGAANSEGQGMIARSGATQAGDQTHAESNGNAKFTFISSANLIFVSPALPASEEQLSPDNEGSTTGNSRGRGGRGTIAVAVTAAVAVLVPDVYFASSIVKSGAVQRWRRRQQQHPWQWQWPRSPPYSAVIAMLPSWLVATKLAPLHCITRS